MTPVLEEGQCFITGPTAAAAGVGRGGAGRGGIQSDRSAVREVAEGRSKGGDGGEAGRPAHRKQYCPFASAAGVTQLSLYVTSLNTLWFHLDHLNTLGILTIWLACILARLYL